MRNPSRQRTVGGSSAAVSGGGFGAGSVAGAGGSGGGGGTPAVLVGGAVSSQASGAGASGASGAGFVAGAAGAPAGSGSATGTQSLGTTISSGSFQPPSRVQEVSWAAPRLDPEAIYLQERIDYVPNIVEKYCDDLGDQIDQDAARLNSARPAADVDSSLCEISCAYAAARARTHPPVGVYVGAEIMGAGEDHAGGGDDAKTTKTTGTAKTAATAKTTATAKTMATGVTGISGVGSEGGGVGGLYANLHQGSCAAMPWSSRCGSQFNSLCMVHRWSSPTHHHDHPCHATPIAYVWIW